MDRITVKLDRPTHQRLVAALVELSSESGRMLTLSAAVEYLMATHQRTPLAAPGVPAGWGRQQLGGVDAQA